MGMMVGSNDDDTVVVEALSLQFIDVFLYLLVSIVTIHEIVSDLRRIVLVADGESMFHTLVIGVMHRHRYNEREEGTRRLCLLTCSQLKHLLIVQILIAVQLLRTVKLGVHRIYTIPFVHLVLFPESWRCRYDDLRLLHASSLLQQFRQTDKSFVFGNIDGYLAPHRQQSRHIDQLSVG